MDCPLGIEVGAAERAVGEVAGVVKELEVAEGAGDTLEGGGG